MMSLEKQYIVQCIVTAANNLRLSSEKIEVVALLRQHLNSCDDLEDEIFKMKKKTETSKFAIKLGEIFSFISESRIDFLKLSEDFKRHSFSIVHELSNLLDVLTPQNVRKVLLDEEKIELPIHAPKDEVNMEILQTIGLNDNDSETDHDSHVKSEGEEIREKIIFNDIANPSSFNFDNYEETILKPVRELDQFLKKLKKYEFSDEEYDTFLKKIRANAVLSSHSGFEIIAQMHNVFAKGLELLRDKQLPVAETVIEGLRSCLIVIVAVVRGKDLDISTYLNRAELFGKKIMGSNFTWERS